MYTLRFVDPEENESEIDICLNNLRKADRYRNLNYFSCAAISWLILNPNKNLQDLEVFLRQNNFDTHTIAANSNHIDSPPKMFLSITGLKDDKLIYTCVFSCRDKISAMKELKTHSKTYEENFEKLALTGIMFSGEEIDQIKEKLKFNERFKSVDAESSIIQSIKYNKKKIITVLLTAEEYFDYLCKLCVEKTGKMPETKLESVNEQGCTIIRLMFNGNPLAPFDFSIKYTKDDIIIMEIIPIIEKSEKENGVPPESHPTEKPDRSDNM